MIRRRIFKLVKWGVVVFGVGLFTLLGIRIYDSQSGPPLEPWHTHIPHELSPDELDHAGWGDYLKAEEAIFDRLRKEVTQKLAPGERSPVNRYFEGSPIYPGHFVQDWNRSYVMEPTLSRCRLCLDRDPAAWSRNSPWRAHDRRVAGLDGRHAAGDP